MKIKVKDKKKVKYKKVDDNKYQEKITIEIVHEYDKAELDAKIAELQDIISSLNNIDDQQLLEWARNNHPAIAQKQQLINELNDLINLRDSIFK